MVNIEISAGDVVEETTKSNQTETFVVTRLEPFNGAALVFNDKGEEALNVSRFGTLTGRLAILEHWDIDKLYRAMIDSYEGTAYAETDGFKEKILTRLQAEYAKGPRPYTANF